MQTYFLSKHIHRYATANTAVLLDLRRDRYIGLGRDQNRLLSSVLAEEPSADRVGEVSESDAVQFVAELEREGLITRARQYANHHRQPAVCPVVARLYECGRDDGARIRPLHLATFATAYLRAKWLMRRGRLDQVFDRVKSRHTALKDRQPDLEAVRELTAVSRALQPLLYTARDNCLLDSLVLLEFLGAYGLAATWVVGVRVWPFPFEAHSWVQLGSYLLNGPSPAFVRGFAPILAV